MRITPLPLRGLFIALMSAQTFATAAALEAPRPWPADPFFSVTAERIANLPFAAQPAWQAYWEKSQKASLLLPARDLVDRSPTHPLAGPPIGASYSRGVRLDAPADWYASDEARAIADRVVNWQTAVGAWMKSGDYSRNRLPADDEHDAWSGGTFDNNATINELCYLARVLHAGGNAEAARTAAWRDSFMHGLAYVFDAQYPNGGFPQIYPLVGWYHDAVTINDDVMLHLLQFLGDIGAGRAEFAFVPAAQAARARESYSAGVTCVLTTQLRAADGRRTVWSQQYDALTLQPCAARNFEPLAECSLESAALVEFLMKQPHPSPELIAAVHGAMRWFESHALSDVHWDRAAPAGTGLESRPGAPALWARFYEFGTGKPIFSERDRMIHYTPTALSFERRKGYGWFTPAPGTLGPLYAEWQKTHPL
jgi:PelA/Pel-15E family pectate lyase